MADSANNSNGGKELLAQVKRLEADLQEIEKTRKQQSLIVRGGLLIMLAVILLFTWNIWNFSKSMVSPENIDKFGQRLGKDLQDLMGDPDVKKIEESLLKQVLPELTEQVIARFKKELPSFRTKGEDVMNNLKTFVETAVKDELETALADSVEQVESEIRTTYPKVSAEKMEKVLEAAEDVFIDHLTHTLENRIELVYDDFMKMESTMKKFSYLEDTRRLDGMKADDIKLEIIESFLELCIYEINPVKGKKTVEIQGGAK